MSRAKRLVQGVALLEALVALVLLASTGVVVVQWLQQGMQTLARLEQRELELADREWALAMLQTRPLWAEPQGQLEREGLQVSWTAVKASVPRANGTPGGVDGPWKLSLVELKVELKRKGQPPQQFPLRLLTQSRNALSAPESGF